MKTYCGKFNTMNNTDSSKLIETKSYLSSMENVRLFKNGTSGSYTLTIIDDDSHGFRTFRFGPEDIQKLRDAIIEL